MSAVLTELLLCVHEPTMLYKLYDARSQLFSWWQISVVRKDTMSLSKHLEYTKSFWMRNDSDETKPKDFEAKAKNVYLAVHSLSLHLQAALFRVQTLEKEFESESTSNDIPGDREHENFETLSYEYCRKQLNAVKSELDSCRGCFEETEARLDNKYKVHDNTSVPKVECSNDDITSQLNDKSQLKKKQTIVLYDMEKPVIEDEVFEAVIDQEYCDRKGEDFDDDFWNADIRKERQLMKRQKKQGKRVLNELQPILVQRRKMWEEREMAALNKQLTKNIPVSC